MATLFVLDRNANSELSIKTMNPDGSNIETIHEGSGYADGIAIDPANKTVYWSNMGQLTDKEKTAFANQDGSINALKFTNNQWVNKVICKGPIYTPKQIYFHEGLIYFCDREGLGVYRVSTSGNLESLLTTGDPQTEMFDFSRQTVGCCVKDGYVYFTQKGPPKGGLGRILRIKTEPVSTLNPDTDLELLIDQLPEPIDLAFGPQSGKLYWTDRGSPPKGNSLNRGIIQGNKIVQHEIIVTGFKEAIGLVISPNESETYVTDLSGKVYAVDNSTGSIKPIYQGIRCTGIGLADKTVYL